jgi:hypothetical protein
MAPDPPLLRQPNPRWIELSQLLERLRTQRLTLVIDRTEAHPAVIDMGLSIAEVERQLAATEKYLPTAPPDNGANPTPPPPIAAQAPAKTSGPRAMSIEMPDPLEGERLRRAWEHVQRELALAEDAWRQAQSTAARPQRPRARIVREGELVAVVGGRPARADLAILAVASVLVGVLVVRLARTPTVPDVFTSVEAVSHVLQVPVVAALSTGDGPRIPSIWPWRIGLGRTLVRAAEVVVIGAVLLFLASAAFDPLVAQVAMDNPLQALSLATERLVSW